eukprot:7484677-Alexandrium_andersonii.AAC.1
MIWAWVPAEALHGLRAGAVSFGGVCGPCGLCAAPVAAGACVRPACAATLRVVRALGLRGRLLDAPCRDHVARTLLFLGEVIEGSL